MIRYSLICKDCKLSYESWFPSSTEYEKLKKKKLLNCHNCNSLNIDKSLMAPSINKANFKKSNKELKKHQKIKKTILEYQNFIKKNFKHVGDNFAFEARSLHYNNKKKEKGIYGTASKEDLKELSEEGIDAQIIPWVDDQNN
tara:strand:- start:105 stop:530 length:426 start_codon:yes stop_codon:yes gene_type:complete